MILMRKQPQKKFFKIKDIKTENSKQQKHQIIKTQQDQNKHIIHMEIMKTKFIQTQQWNIYLKLFQTQQDIIEKANNNFLLYYQKCFLIKCLELWLIQRESELVIEILNLKTFQLIHLIIYLKFVILDLQKNLLKENRILLIFVLDIIEHQSLFLEPNNIILKLMCGLQELLLLNQYYVNHFFQVKMQQNNQLKLLKFQVHLLKNKYLK
ncbi:protein kinase domain protein [Ichthyophthirius multifiliis]|uniref:Protein kinase domain protein n=1 Tax=Ichthyophthirius multifiliis TaxID=5932 RepID=G0QWU9_ICHMU|nr:protein kinase domain protein [Ichthyophthirius multifiliis]EGR30310.1 protein kinase domain protein [Ichthyophthirius multifiliis]|eukprot:XP_004031897.1 protein kinase domain protein [Ichthyophthirius multifiliis]